MNYRFRLFIITVFMLFMLQSIPVYADEYSQGSYNVSTCPGSWFQDSAGNWYWKKSNGSYLESAFITIENYTYYLTSSGIMSVGWEKIDDKWYYFRTWGGMYKNSFVNYEGYTYYLNPNGEMATGWVQIDGIWHYFRSWGGMYKNAFVDYEGYTYYLDPNGEMATGWAEIDGVWHYFRSWGGMYRNSFIQYENNTYYVDINGEMKTGWIRIDGAWYYFRSWGGGAKGWNSLTRGNNNSGNAYWNYFTNSGKFVTDSDSQGCSDGYNTWKDHYNTTISSSSTFKYYITSGHPYSSKISTALNKWYLSVGKRHIYNATDYDYLFSTGDFETSTNARTFFFRGVYQTYVNQEQNNWDFVIISSNVNATSSLNADTFIHEIGHALGLSHRITNTESIMCSPVWGRTASDIQNCDLTV